jgi:5-formyltetrahydrofolate cyclo-ligase
MAAPSNIKATLRKQISAALRTLTPAQLATQSAAVMAHLNGLPAYTMCKSASVYLPMDKGCEVDTWPIVADLLQRGARVAIPRVTGPAPTDMLMLRLSSLEQAHQLPRTKWGIPEPDEALAAQMEDATVASDLTLLLVPGVAFDARCGRLGHGRGYYDAFIKAQRALARTDGTQLVVIGLGLSLQLLETVPMAEQDERLDLVITPEGPLAYTSAADAAHAASLIEMGRKRDRPRDRADRAADRADRADGDREFPVPPPTPPPSAAGTRISPNSEAISEAEGRAAATATAAAEAEATAAAAATGACSLDYDERVSLSTGKYKYACLRLAREGEGSFLAVRSARGSYHADVAEPAIEAYVAMGYV